MNSSKRSAESQEDDAFAWLGAELDNILVQSTSVTWDETSIQLEEIQQHTLQLIGTRSDGAREVDRRCKETLYLAQIFSYQSMEKRLALFETLRTSGFTDPARECEFTIICARDCASSGDLNSAISLLRSLVETPRRASGTIDQRQVLEIERLMAELERNTRVDNPQ